MVFGVLPSLLSYCVEIICKCTEEKAKAFRKTGLRYVSLSNLRKEKVKLGKTWYDAILYYRKTIYRRQRTCQPYE